MQIKQWQDLRINGSVLPSLKKWWENSGSCFFLCCWELLNIGCHVKRLRDFVSWYWPVEHLFVVISWFIYLFIVFRSSWEYFTHIETSKGLQILTYARHSWPLSSECSLACHTYMYTVTRDQGFHGLIQFDLWHLLHLPSVWEWNCHYLF